MSKCKRLLTVLWGYYAAVWGYVVALQIAHPKSVTWQLAWWLAIRLDYLAETAFVASFLLAVLIALEEK